MLINTLGRESLIQRARDISDKPHPMAAEIKGDAVLLEGQLDRFDGATVGEIRENALATIRAEETLVERYRNSSRIAGAAGLVAAATTVAGALLNNSAMMIAGVAGFVGAGATAVVYDHTSGLYADAAKHTEATVARIDKWADFALANPA